MSVLPTQQPTQPAPATFSRRRLRLLALALVLLAVLALAALAAPLALWAYDLQRAGQLLDAGLAWPTPRTAQSLPQARDAGALRNALAYLESAAARRPNHPQAYRLAGQAYLALGELDAAAAAYERAMAVAPTNQLIRWETSLVYAQMANVAKTAPRTDLLQQLVTGQLNAPGELIRSLFCTDQGAASCYRGQTTYEQALATDPRGQKLRAPALFLHPPASVSIALRVPAERAALHFLIGLDPAAREWQSDGATFRVWVTAPTGKRALAAELPIDRETARRGWVPGWANLQPWVGQSITLTLESDAGPNGDTTDDWFAWGEPALTSPSAARYATEQPVLRAQELRKGLK